MTGTIVAGILAAFAVGAVADKNADADGINLEINIGTPPPPAVVVATPPAVVTAPAPVVIVPPPRVITPPQVVAVPSSSVFYAPQANFNLFVYSGRYYSFHQGTWFQATTHNGPWVVIASERVPRAVVGVPASYYRIPPGHAKKHHVFADHPGKGHKGPKGHKGKKDRD
jgi:hypothetical protein